MKKLFLIIFLLFIVGCASNEYVEYVPKQPKQDKWDIYSYKDNFGDFTGNFGITTQVQDKNYELVSLKLIITDNYIEIRLHESYFDSEKIYNDDANNVTYFLSVKNLRTKEKIENIELLKIKNKQEFICTNIDLRNFLCHSADNFSIIFIKDNVPHNIFNIDMSGFIAKYNLIYGKL